MPMMLVTLMRYHASTRAFADDMSTFVHVIMQSDTTLQTWRGVGDIQTGEPLFITSLPNNTWLYLRTDEYTDSCH